MKSAKYVISGLVAAGLLPLHTGGLHADKGVSKTADDGLISKIKNLVDDITSTQKYTLAQHQSHQSHSSHESHQSHGSHRSSSYNSPRLDWQANPAGVVSESTSGNGRNVASTPPSTVLPSSPAIARRVKILPGNSAKFRKAVTEAQLALLARGYDVGQLNGELHARLMAAVYRYQSEAGMVPTGRLTGETLASLGVVAE